MHWLSCTSGRSWAHSSSGPSTTSLWLRCSVIISTDRRMALKSKPTLSMSKWYFKLYLLRSLRTDSVIKTMIYYGLGSGFFVWSVHLPQALPTLSRMTWQSTFSVGSISLIFVVILYFTMRSVPNTKCTCRWVLLQHRCGSSRCMWLWHGVIMVVRARNALGWRKFEQSTLTPWWPCRSFK